MSGFSISDILSPIKPVSLARDHQKEGSPSSYSLGNDVTGDSGYSSQFSSTTSPQQVATPVSGLSGFQLYSQLQQTIAQETYTPPWTLLAASPSAAILETNLVASREHNLRMLLLDPSLNALFPHQIRELQSAYDSEVQRLVSERQFSIQSVISLPWLQQPIDCYYQNQHLTLIDRVQRSVSLLQSSLLVTPSPVTPPNFATSTPKKSRQGKRSRRPLSERSVRIMEKWYMDNQEHPYPSYDSCEVMAEAGDVSVEQVKKWFANRRLRRRNTKTLTEIARRRKVTRPPMDIINAAWRMSDCQ